MTTIREALEARYGTDQFKSTVAANALADTGEFTFSQVYGYITNTLPRIKRGLYTLDPSQGQIPIKDTPVKKASPKPTPDAVMQDVVEFKKPQTEQVSMPKAVYVEPVTVPEKDTTFVSWGNCADLRRIVNSGIFFPVFISGLSGNGKSFMAEQICAGLGRKYVRVQINPETDENDLIGGFQLRDGDTVFVKGPVIRAMEEGAVLCLDEIDRGTNKLMSIQGVMEGKPVLIKKTGEVVTPAPGFTVIATANTKGQGDESGKFIAANILDDAFLERFTMTMDQPYPSANIEAKIVLAHMTKFGMEPNEKLAGVLTKWSSAIRDTYMQGGIEDLVSTRRLCHIVQIESVFGNLKKSVGYALARFDEDTRTAMIDMLTKMIDADEKLAPGEDPEQNLDKELSELFNG